MNKIIITPNEAGQRIDKFMLKFAKKLTKSVLYKAIRNKDVKLNGNRVKGNEMLSDGDVIEYYLHTGFFQEDKLDFLSTSIHLDIVYEDENIIVANKPVGTEMHGSKNSNDNTLTNSLLNYLYYNGEFDPDEELSFRPAFVNRIDRNTSGLVIAGKNYETLKELNQIVRSRQIIRKYLCVVSGVPHPSSAQLKGYYHKDSTANKAFINSVGNDRDPIVMTNYKTLRLLPDGNAVLEVELITGRSHQIRAHLASVGHPIVGDKKYGNISNVPFQKLTAYHIAFELEDGYSKLGYLSGKSFQLVPLPYL